MTMKTKEFMLIGEILQMLEEGKMSMEEMSKMLNYSERTLYRRLKKFNVEKVNSETWKGTYEYYEKTNPSVLNEKIHAKDGKPSDSKGKGSAITMTNENINIANEEVAAAAESKQLKNEVQKVVEDLMKTNELPLFIRAHYLEKPASTSKTNVNLATDLMEWLKDTAAREKISQGELLTLALLDFKEKYFPGE